MDRPGGAMMSSSGRERRCVLTSAGTVKILDYGAKYIRAALLGEVLVLGV